MYVCLLASKKYSNTLESEIDRRLENILKNGKEAARVLRLGSTNNITETNEYKFIEVIWCANFVVWRQKWFQKITKIQTSTPNPYVYLAPARI